VVGGTRCLLSASTSAPGTFRRCGFATAGPTRVHDRAPSPEHACRVCWFPARRSAATRLGLGGRHHTAAVVFEDVLCNREARGGGGGHDGISLAASSWLCSTETSCAYVRACVCVCVSQGWGLEGGCWQPQHVWGFLGACNLGLGQAAALVVHGRRKLLHVTLCGERSPCGKLNVQCYTPGVSFVLCILFI